MKKDMNKKTKKCQVCFQAEAKSIIAYKLKNIRIVSVCDDCKKSIEKFNQIFN